MQFKVNNITRTIDVVNGDSLLVQLADGKTIDVTIKVNLPAGDEDDEEEVLSQSAIRLGLLDRIEEDIRLIHNLAIFKT